MNEREIEVPLHDGKVAHGKLAGEWSWPLIVFVHGLTSHKEEVLPYAAARYFARANYAFLRFDLYDGYPDGRQMSECNLATHAADINAVVDFARQHGTNQVYLACHSLGAYCAAMTEKQWVHGIMLWEPSHPTTPPTIATSYPYIEQLDGYLCNWGTAVILSRRYVQAMEQFHLSQYLDGWTVPTFVATADSHEGIEAGDIYESMLLGNGTDVYRARHITGADHNFTTDRWRELLFAQSLEWLLAH